MCTCHEAVSGGQDLLEYHILFWVGCLLQLLLDEPGTVLILAELYDVALQVL